jgi:purine nucleosidase
MHTVGDANCTHREISIQFTRRFPDMRRSIIFAALWLSGGLGAFAAARIPVILSTDVGNEIDDQWAVLYLLTSPQFEVLGMISAHAPTLPPPSAHYTYRVLVDEVENHLNLQAHPPLFEGSSVALADARTPQPNPGVDFIISASRAYSKDRRLDVLAIGAATDVASAILEDPGIAGRIRVVAMGFNRWPDGGDEFNVANDPRAWQVILDSRVPVVIGCGDVCRAYLALTPEQARALVAGHGPLGAWLWDEYQDWYYRNVKPMRKDDLSKPWIIWDIITAAYVEGLAAGETRPRPRLGDDMVFEHPATSEEITWITSVDSKRLWAEFVARMDDFTRTHAVH